MARWAFGLAAIVLLGGLAGRLERVTVAGASMRPTLEPGDRLLVWRTQRLRPGGLVVLADPRVPGRPLVKRVAGLDGDEAVLVHGDNAAASTDSRVFGAVPRRAVRGRPVYRYFPPGREGWLRGEGRARPSAANPSRAAPVMKSSTICRATESWNCVGGDFMK